MNFQPTLVSLESLFDAWSKHLHLKYTVEPRYNEDLGTMKITLL